MSAYHRLNVRLYRQDIRALERRAQARGVTVTGYVREILDDNLTVREPPLVLQLSSRILLASVSLHRLLAAEGETGELSRLVRETRRLADRLGVGHV